MKNPAFTARLAISGILLSLSQLTPAELFIMNDGSEIEGTILLEDDESYLLEVQIAKTIKDELRILKSDVKSVEIPRPDINEFGLIADLVPIPDLLSADQYQERIEKLQQFLAKFPRSEMRSKVNEMLASHKAEAAVVSEGGIKLNGHLIGPNERSANEYAIQARLMQTTIERHAQEGLMLASLRAFSEFEQDFQGSSQWRSLLPLIRQVIAAHRAVSEEMLHAYDALVEQRRMNLTRVDPQQRRSIEMALQQREDQLKAIHAREKANRSYWLTISEDYKPPLTETVRFADSELKRIETAINQPVPSLTPCQAWDAAIVAIRRGDAAEVQKAIADARAAKMSTRFIDELERLTKIK